MRNPTDCGRLPCFVSNVGFCKRWPVSQSNAVCKAPARAGAPRKYSPTRRIHRFISCSASDASSHATHLVSSLQRTQQLPKAVVLQAVVEKGFGRGAKKLGFPTANLARTDSPDLDVLSNGVYCGWAQVYPQAGAGAYEDGHSQPPPVYKAVVNVGVSPTFGDVRERLVEAHLMHAFEDDFYGGELRLCIIGWLRDEMKFPEFQDLVANISNDVDVAREFLEQDFAEVFCREPFFSRSAC